MDWWTTVLQFSYYKLFIDNGKKYPDLFSGERNRTTLLQTTPDSNLNWVYHTIFYYILTPLFFVCRVLVQKMN
jgi:hypothetical protein